MKVDYKEWRLGCGVNALPGLAFRFGKAGAQTLVAAHHGDEGRVQDGRGDRASESLGGGEPPTRIAGVQAFLKPQLALGRAQGRARRDR